MRSGVTGHLDSVAERSAALALARCYELRHYGARKNDDPGYLLDRAGVWRPLPDFRLVRRLGDADPIGRLGWVEFKRIHEERRRFRAYGSPWLQYADADVTVLAGLASGGYWRIDAAEAVRRAKRLRTGGMLWLEWPISAFQPVVFAT